MLNNIMLILNLKSNKSMWLHYLHGFVSINACIPAVPRSVALNPLGLPMRELILMLNEISQVHNLIFKFLESKHLFLLLLLGQLMISPLIHDDTQLHFAGTTATCYGFSHVKVILKLAEFFQVVCANFTFF